MLTKEMKLLILFCIQIPMLFGCATEEVRIASAQSSIPSCCKSLKQLPFEKINVNNKVRININKNSKLYKFEEGKSFFRAFSLGGEINAITVRSYYEAYGLTSHVFRPVITFLDEKKTKIRTVIPPLIQSENRIKDTHVYFSININKREKYIVIHTDDESYGDAFYHYYPKELVKKKEECINPAVAGTLFGALGGISAANCGDTGRDIPYGVIGILEIETK